MSVESGVLINHVLRQTEGMVRLYQGIGRTATGVRGAVFRSASWRRLSSLPR